MLIKTSVTADRVAWSLAELSAAYGVSVGFLRKEIQRGTLRARKLGRRVVVLTQDLEQYLSSEFPKPTRRKRGTNKTGIA